ncbi:uncharacterized protein LOC62_05G007528 [Vanrija pseudolonga]|uniref:Ser-Thr-rich glycosyl-phosphatidyl-inositol-anchored membrane family-domain-containing protein n=1 Tax=Vanrija pseudolonga TaxID=143232 RepID=A0AAF0YI33_9TREE|nr:hypothetical protein LOC62_05G007528 [Vanrija pseudolonga]
MTPLLLLVLLAHAALVLAQAAGSTLSIYSPSGSVWWVQNANNTLAWMGTGPTAFAVWLSNPDVTLIPADVKLKTFIRTTTSSLSIWSTRAPPGPNYTLKLTAVNDTSTLYATSDAFQIVPFGSPRAQVSTSAPAASGTGALITDPGAAGTGAAAPVTADPNAGGGGSPLPTDGSGNPGSVPGTSVAATNGARALGASLVGLGLAVAGAAFVVL